ncbi:type IV secretion system protein VirD4, partial [mine drainage metagenome]
WLSPCAGAKAFSMRAWARDGAGAAWWNYQDAQVAAMRLLLSTQMDLAALGILEQPEDPERRTWLIIDELGAIGRIAALEDYLTRARKAGGCAVLGLQSIDQLMRLYGQHSAYAILTCCVSQLVLAIGDPNTADYLSRGLGEQQVSRISRAAGRADHGAQQTQSRQISVERVVLPSELDPSQLPPLCGFLKLGAGHHLPIAPVHLQRREWPTVAPAYVAAPLQPVPPPAAPLATDFPEPPT